ncbi:hypothetical protein BB559_002315 [Furculomyces boomerangus]|uniref:RING-type domain-containing protein n=1 Tax=Furculomyces boomerangus TaxID=61424 RepID=A0A2T9YW89_9FUNG|nr:hypothetical protein BB559_002315 [Furculomyces boomerangus]
MSNVQLRHFDFFKRKTLANLPPFLKSGCQLVYSVNGADYIFLVNDGWVYIIDNEFNSCRFSSSEIAEDAGFRVVQLFYNVDYKYLFTIKENISSNTNPILEIWKLRDLSQNFYTDKDINPEKLLLKKIVVERSFDSPFPVTAISISPDLSLAAIGFGNGSLVLIRGGLTNEKTIKQEQIYYSEEPITNLHFVLRPDTKNTNYLYATTTGQTLLYNITPKIESKTVLESRGCGIGCTTLSEDGNLSVAHEEAIYFYNIDGRGPCFAYEGTKMQIKRIDEYLLIATNENVLNRASNNDISPELNKISNHLDFSGEIATTFSIFDMKNKLLASRSLIPGGIKSICVNWNGILVFGNLGTLDYFEEVDLKSRIDLVCKQNLYMVATNIAQQSTEENKEELIAKINLENGDYLMEKNEPDLAIIEFIKTVGYIDPSFVIVKLLDIQHIDILIKYLEKLHEQHEANNDHTLLLITFIQICAKEGHYKTALLVAKRFDVTHSVLNIMLYNLSQYEESMDYIEQLFQKLGSKGAGSMEFTENLDYVLEFGRLMLSNVPLEFINFLVNLCVDYNIRPKKFKPLFAGNDNLLVFFYEKLCFLKYDVNIDTCSYIEFKLSTQKPNYAEGLTSQDTNIENDIENSDKPYIGISSGVDDYRNQIAIYNDLLELYLSGADTEYKVQENNNPKTLTKTADKEPNTSDNDIVKDFSKIPIYSVSGSTHDKALKLLSLLSSKGNSLSNTTGEYLFDYDYAYILCAQEGFEEGLLFLHKLKENENSEKLLLFYFEQLKNSQSKDATAHAVKNILELLSIHSNKNLKQSRPLYRLALVQLSKTQMEWVNPEETQLVSDALSSCLDGIYENNILSPIEVLQLLDGSNKSSSNSGQYLGNGPKVTLGALKPYLQKVYSQQATEIDENLEQIAIYNTEIEKMHSEVNSLLNEPVLFDPPKTCSSCLATLSLPAVYFYCKHAFHQKCISNNISDEDISCLVCKTSQMIIQENYNTLSRTPSSVNYSKFIEQLSNTNKNQSGFNVLTDWLSRSSI